MEIIINKDKILSDYDAWPIWQCEPSKFDWEYEKEWRMCSLLEDCDKTIESVPYPIHLFKFPKSAVKEVILGACMENSVKSNLLSLIRDKFDHISVKQAKVSSEEFSIRFVDLC